MATRTIAINNLTISSPLPSGYLNVLIANNNGLAIRSTSLKPDSFGSFYYYDNHFPEINRIDQYTGMRFFFTRTGLRIQEPPDPSAALTPLRT
jgi:hypothetical protein